MYRHICVPVDNSEHDNAASDLGGPLGRPRQAPDSLIRMGLRLISDSYLDAMARKAEAAGLAVERKTFDGKHHTVLLEDAQRSDYDLLVLGALGMGAVKDSQLGSVVERFIRG